MNVRIIVHNVLPGREWRGCLTVLTTVILVLEDIFRLFSWLCGEYSIFYDLRKIFYWLTVIFLVTRISNDELGFTISWKHKFLCKSLLLSYRLSRCFFKFLDSICITESIKCILTAA